MKRFIIPYLLMILLPALAQADQQWTPVGDTEAGNSYYLELSSLKKTAQGGRIWSLVSMTEPKDGFLSARTLFEFNCRNHKHQIIDMAFYAGAMGQGDQIKNIVIPKAVWVPTDPNSTEGAYLEMACDRLRAASRTAD